MAYRNIFTLQFAADSHIFHFATNCAFCDLLDQFLKVEKSVVGKARRLSQLDAVVA